jgi:pyrroloquinoline quinone biosynthesis protein A
MARGLVAAAASADHAHRAPTLRPHPAAVTATCWRLPMTWTTPTATDFRFGFEITMYVAAR